MFGAAIAGQHTPGHVLAADAAPLKTAPHGKASVRLLSEGAESAFVGILSIEPGITIPVHRDESEEFIYMLEGGGTISIDGVESPVGPGDFVFMPANAEVSFSATDSTITKALQIFAPPESAAKYDGWQ
jgi:quercetin dioxygenase-like cupin family protein